MTDSETAGPTVTDSETQTTVENLMALNMLIFYFVTSMFTEKKLPSLVKLLFHCCCLAFCLLLLCLCFVASLFLFCFAGLFLFCCWPVTVPLLFLMLLLC